MAIYRARCSGFPSVGRARRAVVAYAKAAGFRGDDLTDIESAVGEALANAAEHGGRNGGSFEIAARIEFDALVIDVVDDGTGFEQWDATDFLRPLSSAPRGFGIFIMRAVMDRVEYSDGGRRLRLVKRLPHAGDREGGRREA